MTGIYHLFVRNARFAMDLSEMSKFRAYEEMLISLLLNDVQYRATHQDKSPSARGRNIC